MSIEMPRWGGEADPIGPAPATPPPRTIDAPVDPVVVTEQTWPPLAIALLRGAIEGFVLAALDALTALSLDASPRTALISAGIILFGRLAIALGVGQIDQANSRRVNE